MRNIPSKVALLAAAALTAAVLPAGAASAKAASISDATGDNWSISYNPDTGEYDYEKAGSKLNSDIKKTVVKNGDKRVDIVTTFKELKKKDNSGVAVFSTLRFKKSLDIPKHSVEVWSGENWEAMAHVYPHSEPSRGVSHECEGLKAAFNFKKNRATVKVPRSCLGNPSWVQFNGGASGYTYDPETESYKSYVDNAQNKGHDHGGWSDKIAKG